MGKGAFRSASNAGSRRAKDQKMAQDMKARKEERTTLVCPACYNHVPIATYANHVRVCR